MDLRFTLGKLSICLLILYYEYTLKKKKTINFLHLARGPWAYVRPRPGGAGRGPFRRLWQCLWEKCNLLSGILLNPPHRWLCYTAITMQFIMHSTRSTMPTGLVSSVMLSVCSYARFQLFYWQKTQDFSKTFQDFSGSLWENFQHFFVIHECLNITK